MDNMTWQCFVAVAETRSFTRTAARLGRTQSAISQQIAKLEEYLGVCLFQRGKHMIITAEGQILLPYAKQMVALHAAILDRFQAPDLAGEVRFGLPEDFATVFLSDVLADFARAHPRVHLKVECDLTVPLFQRFKLGEFDLVLLKMAQPDDFPNGVHVWSETLQWVAQEHFLRPASAVWEASCPVPLVLSPEPCVYRARALAALDQAGIPWRLVVTSPSYAGVVAAVRAGLGITVLPRTLIGGALCALPADAYHLPVLSNVHISLLKHAPHNSAVQSLEGLVLHKLLRG